MIDKSVVDGALKSHPVLGSKDSEEFGNVFSQLDTIPPNGEVETSIFPSLITSFPLYYRNKSGDRIAICGEIAVSTRDHVNGFRYFDHQGHMYRRDGSSTVFLSLNDLVERLDAESNVPLKTVVPGTIWVNPKHQLSHAFFRKIDSSKRLITVGRRYVNRMGFVKEIIETSNSDGFVIDSFNSIYDKDGHASPPQTSMYDLIYEIVDWKSFEPIDWSKEELITSFAEQENPPELFDPFLEDHNAMLEEFYRSLLRSHTLATKLKMKYSFSILPADMSSDS